MKILTEATVGFRLLILILIPAIGGCSYLLVATGPKISGTLPIDRQIESAIAFEDSGGKSSLRFLVVGDAGSASKWQHKVGAAMAEVCSVHGGCDFALMPGDLIYEAGVRHFGDGTFDSRFQSHFEAPYATLGRLDFWAVAGNHDWYRARSVEAQILYSMHSERWRMPSLDYEVPGLPEWISIYGLDTTLLRNGVETQQLQRARDTLCARSGWRLLFGHHGVHAVGKHADRTGRLPGMDQVLEPMLLECEVHALFVGHDHLQAHVSTQYFEQIIQGAGGKTLHSVRKKVELPEGVTRRVVLREWGFALVEAEPASLTIRFFAVSANQTTEAYCGRIMLEDFKDPASRITACKPRD